MNPTAKAILAVLQTLQAPYVTADKAEAAKAERERFLPVMAVAMTSASEEATCSGPWADDPDCKRKWPGGTVQGAAMLTMAGYSESRFDPRIQAGDCQIWGPKTTQRECDGALFPLGAAPAWVRGIHRNTKWGTVVFRSVTVFQLRDLPNEKRDLVVGLGEQHLYESARAAMGILSGHRRRCHSRDWVTCTISGYAGTISYKQAPQRAAFFYRIEAKIEAELAIEQKKVKSAS